jgi:hypothetical protein
MNSGIEIEKKKIYSGYKIKSIKNIKLLVKRITKVCMHVKHVSVCAIYFPIASHDVYHNSKLQ